MFAYLSLSSSAAHLKSEDIFQSCTVAKCVIILYYQLTALISFSWHLRETADAADLTLSFCCMSATLWPVVQSPVILFIFFVS